MSAVAIAAVTAIVAGGITAGLTAILHVLEPEYDPSWRMISEYSLGRYGPLMRVAFDTMAIGLAATRAALWSRILSRSPATAGSRYLAGHRTVEA